MTVNPDTLNPSGEPRPQRYHSPLRAERAADTRQRIADSALDLFTEHGFIGTTITAIAERAGVAPQTIYGTFGTKAAILRALLARMEDDAGAAQWRERIAAADDPVAKLEAFAYWNASMFAASKALITVAQTAIGDPAILSLRDEANRHRRGSLTTLIDSMASRDALAAGLSPERAVDRAWMLTGVELYLAATDGCGWAESDYARWLADLLIRELLGGPSRD